MRETLGLLARVASICVFCSGRLAWSFLSAWLGLLTTTAIDLSCTLGHAAFASDRSVRSQNLRESGRLVFVVRPS